MVISRGRANRDGHADSAEAQKAGLDRRRPGPEVAAVAAEIAHDGKAPRKKIRKWLRQAPAQNGDAGGLNHGKAMWGAVVDRNGQLCALAVSTEDMAVTWPGSRGIAIAKASTSNAFSSDTLR